MSRPALPALLILLALAAAGGGWWLLSGREAESGGPAAARPSAGAADLPAGAVRPAGTRPAASGSAEAPLAAPVETLHDSGAPRRAYGRVVDPSGAGVADAEIAAFRETSRAQGVFEHEREPLAVTARTDAGGRFELVDLPTAAALGVEVRHPDFAPTERTPFTVSEAQSTDLGDIALEAGLLLIGNVLAADGQKLAGATVSLSELGAQAPEAGGPEPRLATTADDGEYRFDHLAPRQYTVAVEKQGFAPRAATLALVFGAATGSARQDFRLLPAGEAIAGQVRDHEDRPVPGLSLRLTQQDRNAHDYFTATETTDAQGRFAFGSVAVGLYQLETLGAAWFLPKPLTVNGGDRALDVRVQPARSVTGRLQGASGPPRDFRVTIRPQAGSGARLLGETRPALVVQGAEPAGQFVFTGLRPGSYRFEIQAPLYAATTSGDVILGDDSPSAEVVIALDQGGTLEGRVAPAAGGVAVELRAGDFDPGSPMESVLPTQPIHDLAVATDAQGAFHLEHVPAGHYTLTARAPGTPPLHVRDVEVLEGGRRDLGLLELPQGGFIFGNVLGVDGAPSVGARVTALAPGLQEQAITDTAGAFRLPPLPAGEYQLRAVPATMWEALRYEAQTTVTLQAGQEAPVLLSFVERTVTPH